MEDTIIDTVKENEGRYRIVLNPQFDMEVDEGEYYAVRRKPIYPQTYEECCEVLSLGEDGRLYTKGYKANLIQDFQKLIICRDSYWKIAGEQMGLDKPWEPDWSSFNSKKFILYICENKIHTGISLINNHILAFPTEEMRYEFYKNFEELIIECKELL